MDTLPLGGYLFFLHILSDKSEREVSSVLIITRKIGESFRIGDDVEVLVANVAGVSVKLGVEAPRHIQVHREEVHERIVTTSASMNEF
jgi:carbon storage regulator